MRPLFSYFGGKYRDAYKYPAPAHETIIEPFAGSAGYALRNRAEKAILCDLDPFVAEAWRYLIKVSEAEILGLPDVPLDGTVHDIDVCWEARNLISFWLNKGTTHPANRPSAWMRSGLHRNSFWGEHVRRSIAENLPIVRQWKIYNCSYIDAPIDHKTPATWFIDPPYEEQGNRYRVGSKSINYNRLAEWCKSLRGQVIVCEQEGANWLPFEPLHVAKTTRKGRPSRESVWIKSEAAP